LFSLEACNLSCDAEAKAALVNALDRVGSLRFFLRGHRGNVNAVAFRPDGGQLVSGGADGDVVLWDAVSGRPLHRFRAGTPVNALAYVAGGAQIAVAAGDLTLLNADDGTIVRSIESTYSTYGSCISPGSETIAIPDGAKIQLRSLATGKLIRAFQARESILALACSPSGGEIADADYLGVSVWDVRTGARTDFDDEAIGAGQLAFSPDGSKLAASVPIGTVLVWDVGTRDVVHTLHVTADSIWCLAFSPDGYKIAAGADKTVALWSADGGSPRLFSAHDDSVSSISFGPDGALATGGADSTVAVWDLRRAGTTTTLGIHPRYAESLAFDQAGRVLASGGTDGNVLLWDTAGRRKAKTLRAHHGDVTSVAFVPGSRDLVSGGRDRTVRIWDATEGRLLRTLPAGGPVEALDVSPDGQFLAASAGATVVFWKLPAGQRVRALPAQTRATALAFSPDAGLLASAQGSGVRLYDLRRRAWLPGALGRNDGSAALAFSPDGKVLAAEEGVRTVVLWSVATRRRIATLRGHDNVVDSLRFARDGRNLISGSLDGTVRLWDVRSARSIASIGLGKTVWSVAVSDAGRIAAALGDGNVVLLSQLLPVDDTGALYPYFCGIARRNLTGAEWSQFVPGLRYHRTCPSYPAQPE
jgi:WD40 repeat protein